MPKLYISPNVPMTKKNVLLATRYTLKSVKARSSLSMYQPAQTLPSFLMKNVRQKEQDNALMILQILLLTTAGIAFF